MSEWPPMPDNVWSETDWNGECKVCGKLAHWISCPTGGWWAHNTHPQDGHDAELGWQPEQEMNERGEMITVGAFKCSANRPS